MLFLGDYVDRGDWGVEVFLFIASLRLNYPSNVVLLRGNHESYSMNESFNFRSEVLEKFDGDEEVYEAFQAAFQSLMLAAEIDDDYLCMHGGISPDLHSIADVNKIKRHEEPPLEGIFCDLLWADPSMDSKSRTTKFVYNQPRECSYKFGLGPVKELLSKNNYLSIFRAHEVQMDGYKFHRWGGKASFPSIITVFSAPNYCRTHGNKAAVVYLDGEGKMQVK